MNGHAPAMGNGEPSELSVNSFKPLLSKLLSRPQEFSPEDLRLSLLHVASGNVAHAQTGSFLAALRMVDSWRKAENVGIIVQVLSELCGKVQVGGEGHICDWTLTGDSALSVINVALPAAIVAAGAGCRVVRHGNSSSPWPSTPSSGDILTALNVPTTTLPPYSLTKVAASRHVPFLHIFTPRYSPRLAAVSPLDRELGFETIFHSFASLVSPAKRDYCVIGVHEERLGLVFAEALKVQGVKRAWVVHGKNGLDGISPEGETLVWELRDSQISSRSISPAAFGVQERPLSSIQLPSNGDSSSSAAAYYSIHAKIIGSLLSPSRLRKNEPITTPYEPDAYGTTQLINTEAVEEFVCMNAAALLLVSGKATDEKDAYKLARRSLREGKAYHALEALRDAAALAVDVDGLETPQPID